MTNSNPTDDTLLMAVRYVLNECDATELAAFEARLGDDPAAQEALVEAVRIVALLQKTPTCQSLESSLQAAPGRAAPARRSWKPAALVTASLLVAVAVIWQSRPATQNRQVAIHDSPALAQVWTTLDADQIVAEVADEEATEDSADELETASDVPDWLLTAVLVEEANGQSDDEMGFDEETQL